MLVYDVTGSTLVGPVHCALQVYYNCLASLAASDFRDPDGSVRVADVDPKAVRALYLDLLRAGASNLRDNPQPVADLPLTTVTFFQTPGSRSPSNAFSYTDPSSGPQAKAIVRGFLGEHFPDRC